MSDSVLRHYWHPVATTAELTETPLATRLLDERIVLFRAGPRIVALQDLCIHRGTALSLGWIEGENLVCAYHGWEYGADGGCVRIPSLAAGREIPRKACVPAYPVRERYGLIWVCLDHPRAEIPDFPEAEDPAFHTFFYGAVLWNTGAARMIENFFDVAHLPWVHPGLIGDRARPEVPDYPVERRGNELTFQVEIAVPYEKVFQGAIDRIGYRVVVPFAAQAIRLLADGKRYVLSTLGAPVSEKEVRRYLLISRNYDQDRPDDDYQRFTDLAFQQDRRIVESQRPEALPVDLRAELQLKGPDAAALQYRRMLAELGLESPVVA
jgi:phenylpropionate dioxygenase-like ring-hydroxylating dioxygenase large terminal subunit